MKPSSQIAILKTIVKWQVEEIKALQWRVEVLERKRPNFITGSIQGYNGTVTMTIPPQWEDGDTVETV